MVRGSRDGRPDGVAEGVLKFVGRPRFTADEHGRVREHVQGPTVLIGCEPRATDELEDALSDPVRAAVPRAADHVETVLEEIRALEDTQQ